MRQFPVFQKPFYNFSCIFDIISWKKLSAQNNSISDQLQHSNMHQEYQFMAACILPAELSDEFFDLLSYQDVVVNKYLAQGKLIHYALSLDNARLWALFSANSELEVLEMLREFPLTRFLEVEISLLTTYATLSVATPSFSMN